MTSPNWIYRLTNIHYDKAPIREAIIDIQIESPSPLKPIAFERPQPLLAMGYSGRNPMMLNQLRGQMEDGGFTATASQDPVGYAFVGADGKHVVQFRVNGYVNQLDLPVPIRDFRDFIRVYPEVSADINQQLAGFFLQVQIPQEDLGAMLVLNEALVPPSQPDVVSVVLDIDVFKADVRLEDDDDLWKVLEALRLRKNLVFESCITNHTRELIS